MAWNVDDIPIGPGLVKRHGRLDVNMADPRRTDESITVPAPHGYTHGASGGDPVTVAMTQVTGLVAELGDLSDAIDLKADSDDARFTDARTPTAHAASHEDGGSDELELAIAQITGLQAQLDYITALLIPDPTGVAVGWVIGMTGGGPAWIDPDAAPAFTYDSATLYDTAATYEEA